jgi:uncharacterized DUF497 family protein
LDNVSTARRNDARQSRDSSIRGVVVVVFARLGGEGVSIISMRPAGKDERKQYAER